MRGDLGFDPVHGREWDTHGEALQSACTFELPSLRTCGELDPSCECATPANNPPLCTTKLGEQIRGRATPSARPLQVARGLGDEGAVGSVCAPPEAFLDAVTARVQAILSRPYAADDGGCDGFR